MEGEEILFVNIPRAGWILLVWNLPVWNLYGAKLKWDETSIILTP